MSAAVTSDTYTPTIPHGNLTDICHSVQVRSDPNAKYNSQRYHDLLKGAFATLVLNIFRPLTLKNLWNNSCNQFTQVSITCMYEKFSRCAQ